VNYLQGFTRTTHLPVKLIGLGIMAISWIGNEYRLNDETKVNFQYAIFLRETVMPIINKNKMSRKVRSRIK